jgi:uncharacterized protein (DUF4415 family)
LSRGNGINVCWSCCQEAKVTIAIDRDVLEWFQAQGDKANLQMALALKIYAEANKAYSLER